MGAIQTIKTVVGKMKQNLLDRGSFSSRSKLYKLDI